MQLTNPLLHALLAACDRSYNPAPTQAQALAPYLDTPGGDLAGNYWPAMWPTADLDGWKEAKRFDEPGTGFGAVVYQKSAGNGKFDYIVALQGTRGPNAQDWHGNLTVGRVCGRASNLKAATAAVMTHADWRSSADKMICANNFNWGETA